MQTVVDKPDRPMMRSKVGGMGSQERVVAAKGLVDAKAIGMEYCHVSGSAILDLLKSEASVAKVSARLQSNTLTASAQCRDT